jgi:hypothetical protein
MGQSGQHLHAPRADVAVLVVTEPGRLERMSLLLCETIRLRGGRFARIPIYSFAPRRGAAIGERTRRRFGELDVIHIEGPFNTVLPAFGVGNKAYIAAWAEASLPHERFVILDSDTMVLSEPAEFDLPSGADIALTLEPLKVAGTDDHDDNTAMWDAYEEHLGVDGPHRYVRTLVHGERIRAYYNGGCVIFRRELGLMAPWLEAMERLCFSGLVPGDVRAQFTDQISMAITIRKLGIDPHVLPRGYNYQIPWHHELTPEARVSSLDEVVIAHYHDLLEQPTRRNPLTLVKGLALGARDEEIGELIHRCGVSPNPVKEPLRAGKVVVRDRLAKPVAKKLGMRRDRWVKIVQPAGGQETG